MERTSDTIGLFLKVPRNYVGWTTKPVMGGRSKMRNQRVKAYGYTFDSKAEYRHYCELCLQVRAGLISDLKVHPRFNLEVNGVEITTCVPDFSFKREGVLHVHDVKGQRSGVPYQLFTVKKRLMKAILNIDVEEI